MKIISSAFENNLKIPAKYTCEGKDINPPLEFANVPPKTKSIVLIMDDPDSPTGTWDHWIMFNLSPSLRVIEEGKAPDGLFGINSWGKKEYGGPCPGSGKHRYFFNLYSLDIILDLGESSTKEQILNAMEGHIIEQTELIGLYERKVS